MSEIDWSKAPKDTQRHYMFPNGELLYMREVNGRVLKYIGHNLGADMWVDCGLSTVYPQWICAQRGDDEFLPTAITDPTTQRTAESSAVKTLESLGYVWNGGEQWKPPIGNAPSYITDEIDNTVTQRGERYQYTSSDLRGKYVEVGTKACEVFLNLCERFDIKWQDGKPVRKYEIKSTYIAVDIKHCRLVEAPYGIDILNSYTPFILVGVPVTDEIDDTVTQRGERYGLFADGAKYERTLVGLCGTHVKTDVYRVLDAFNTGDPTLDHLIKKALCAGLRGHKDKLTDYRNIVESAEKALKLLEQKQNGN